MIPKKIHYCWFSKDPYPQIVEECIASWKKYMPDWEYVLWDYDKVKDIDSIWLKECIDAKKWAFAADYIRLWAVYHEGGVYLDSDVFVFQSFNSFLKDRMFIGRESVEYHTFDDGVQVYLTSHCFGAEANHPFVKLNLAYYQDRHFQTCSSIEIPNLLRYDMLMMPFIQSRLAETLGYDPVPLASEHQSLPDGMEIYPPYYFCWSPEYPDVYVSKRFAQHLGQGSWREPEYRKKTVDLPIDWKYKIRWRLVFLLEKMVKCFDYKLVRIHPDGRI